MPSTFLNLLRFARSPQVEATENFATEALAACIRSDPSPFLTLLERLSVIASEDDVREVVALTQVAVAGAGVLDLVLQLRLPERLREVWIEVKVASGETGHQLDNYESYIKARPGQAQPELVTLSRLPIRPDPHLLWISWQAVRREALRSSDPYWADFALFLEEIHMADEFDAPVSSREAASLDGAARLLGKTRRILWPVVEEARAKWPQAPWPSNEEELRRNLAVWYRDRGRYTAQMGDYGRRGTWLVIGVWPGEGEAELGVGLVSDPKALEVRSVLIGLADQNGLSAHWSRHMAGWEALNVRERLVAFADHDQARTWLSDRLSELGEAGLLAFVGKDVPIVD